MYSSVTYVAVPHNVTIRKLTLNFVFPVFCFFSYSSYQLHKALNMVQPDQRWTHLYAVLLTKCEVCSAVHACSNRRQLLKEMLECFSGSTFTAQITIDIQVSPLVEKNFEAQMLVCSLTKTFRSLSCYCTGVYPNLRGDYCMHFAHRP